MVIFFIYSDAYKLDLGGPNDTNSSTQAPTTQFTTQGKDTTTKVPKTDKYVKESTFVAVTVILTLLCFGFLVAFIVAFIKCRARSEYGSFSR